MLRVFASNVRSLATAASNSATTTAIRYANHGAPSSVLKCVLVCRGRRGLRRGRVASPPMARDAPRVRACVCALRPPRRKEQVPLAELGGKNSVQLKMLFAPINPADLNMVEGNYALLPPVPAVGGNEGTGVVERVSADVKHLAVGDHVITTAAGLGARVRACRRVAVERAV